MPSRLAATVKFLVVLFFIFQSPLSLGKVFFNTEGHLIYESETGEKIWLGHDSLKLLARKNDEDKKQLNELLGEKGLGCLLAFTNGMSFSKSNLDLCTLMENEKQFSNINVGENITSNCLEKDLLNTRSPSTGFGVQTNPFDARSKFCPNIADKNLIELSKNYSESPSQWENAPFIAIINGSKKSLAELLHSHSSRPYIRDLIL